MSDERHLNGERPYKPHPNALTEEQTWLSDGSDSRPGSPSEAARLCAPSQQGISPAAKPEHCTSSPPSGLGSNTSAVASGSTAAQDRLVTLEIHEATAYPGKPLQVSIGNDQHGYRLAGPKYGAAGSRLLKRIEITPRDAAAMIGYLQEVVNGD